MLACFGGRTAPGRALRLLPIFLGASESPFVTSTYHECCKGSGTGGSAWWADAWLWGAGLEHLAAAHHTAPDPQALPQLCVGLALCSNPVQAVCPGTLMQIAACWASSSLPHQWPIAPLTALVHILCFSLVIVSLSVRGVWAHALIDSEMGSRTYFDSYAF